MADPPTQPRTTTDVLWDMEKISHMLQGLACAIEIIGSKARSGGVDQSEGIAVEVLGEAMGHQVGHLNALIDEGCALGKR